MKPSPEQRFRLRPTYQTREQPVQRESRIGGYGWGMAIWQFCGLRKGEIGHQVKVLGRRRQIGVFW